MTARQKTPEYLRTERRKTPAGCGLVELALLWPKRDNNIGTLARTCDAVGACLVLPHTPDAQQALRRGNTIGIHHSPVHWVGPDTIGYLSELKLQAHRKIWAVELAHDAMTLRDVPTVGYPVTVLLGHEANGIPKEAWEFVDEVIEIPMVGVGNSLNVAVAGSLVAYKLAGMT